MPGAFLREDLRELFDCDEFASRGVYRFAAGGSKAVKVIFDQPIEDMQLGSGGVTGTRLTCQVQVCQLPEEPVRGDVLVLQGPGLTTYAVLKARRNLAGDVWIVELNS